MNDDSPDRDRRGDILSAALREQDLARRGRRVLSAGASVVLIVAVAGIVAWRVLPTSSPISPDGPVAESPEDRAIREKMAGQPRIPTPEESGRQDPRFRLIAQEPPRLTLERVATTPGISKRLAAGPTFSTVSPATDEDLAQALHQTLPGSGLVRVDGRLYAASGDTLVRPEDLQPPESKGDEPRSVTTPQPSPVGV
ncbi:MAG: hypothetical protein IT434_09205 [Phycisphaerales bacterium]|jgi:hypothetical protein|nr:hypothetical protein [Phycisphaerales bacterium]